MTTVHRTAIGLASLVVLAALMVPHASRQQAAAPQERSLAQAEVLVSAETPEALQSDMTYGDRTAR